MKENFPNLVKKIDMQVQEAQRVPNKMDAKRPTPRHIIIKMPKVKDRDGILEASRERFVITNNRAAIRLSADFSTETLQVKRDSHKIYKAMKSKGQQPRVYPANPHSESKNRK